MVIRLGVARIALSTSAPPDGGSTKGILTAVLDLAKRQRRQPSKRRNRSLTHSNPLRIVHGQNPAWLFETTEIGYEDSWLGREDSERVSAPRTNGLAFGVMARSFYQSDMPGILPSMIYWP